MYEGTAGVRLDSTGEGNAGAFPRDWIDCYREGRWISVSMGAADGTMIEHKISYGNAVSLAFGLLRAGLDFQAREQITKLIKLVLGDDPRG